MSNCVTAGFETVTKIANEISAKINIKPSVGIICGSGLGKIADRIENKTIIPYADIPNFPQSTVKGHTGNFVFGKLGGKSVVAMQGRFHGYEGYTKHEIAIPIRVMKLLGVTSLLISNAAGGVNRQLNMGDIVVIKDHISFPGLSMNGVLVGPNDDNFGPRFVATSDAYDSNMRKLAFQIAEKNKFRDLVHEGVYVHSGGPNYESPAECKMFLLIGGDVVGMSTVPEVLIARHCGIRVFAVSLVTNITVFDVESKEKANHEEVLQTAEKRTETIQLLFTKLIEELSQSE